ncbi:MAG: SufS family cysteine desulfurase [Candidatus Niyogibacteria bacterium]|nr:SufS family cysteine desulfurase [Candidatus Niyogibacteria bacterium]
MKRFRDDFPILKMRQNGPSTGLGTSTPFIYFDNAATTQKPRQIVEKLKEHYATSHANVHRGVYRVAEEATRRFEEAREKVARFIGARSNREIIFTRNATEAINLVASVMAPRIKKGDRILTLLSEHHSNFVPWMRLAQKQSAHFDVAGLTLDRRFDFADFEKKLTSRTKIVAVAHISNVSGHIYPVEKIVKAAHKAGAWVLVDGAQSAGHMNVNVAKMGCDFFALSGHKMLAPSGIGALYGREEILNELEPFLSGGEMIREVTTESASWNELPWKFEAGTPNIEGAILLGEAIDYLQKLEMKNVAAHEDELLRYALEKMKKLDCVDLLGMESAKDRVGVISFALRDVHPHDVASILDEKYGIAVRAGTHCAQPFMRHLGVPATTRASFYFYNTKPEIDVFIRALGEIHREFT